MTWVDAIYNSHEPSRARVNTVRFGPGGRSFWHSTPSARPSTSPKARGLIQTRGEASVQIRAGDPRLHEDTAGAVYTPGDEEH